MLISSEKSSFLFNDIDDDTRRNITDLLPYKMEPIIKGFKYLGYRLKPLGYRTNDWQWLLTMFEKRINNWKYRMLSLGGKVVLIRSVLTGIFVYWFALMCVPSSIINTLRRIIFSFLWGSCDGKQRLHLVSLHTVVAPYNYGV